ncbi:MAG: Rv3235 family protein [Micrococcaceae bacterium]
MELSTLPTQHLGRWTIRFITLLLETLRSERSLLHMQELLASPIYVKLKRRISLIQRALLHHHHYSPLYKNPTVKKIYVSGVNPYTYEIATVVEDRTRVRSIALRIERTQNTSWQVTDLEIG